MSNKSNKLWSGRFTKSSSMDDFHSSIDVDSRMIREDIMGSAAHAKMLAAQGIISHEDAAAITEELHKILASFEEGKIVFSSSDEDIHMLIESLLTQRIGDAGKRLHTGRSRNDQVALDCRMYLIKGANETIQRLLKLEEALLHTAQIHLNTIMPGYTHMQKAQPISLAHYLMAYFEMFRRDIERLCGCKSRMDSMPLGSGALAGSTYPLDRESVKQALGFSSITRNSIDAVSDRDFCIEYASCASIIMMHLSRFCEELILWSTDEFNFVEIDEAYSTGSSIMPQKKNPDAAELIRGKTGRVYGDLFALLTIMKGLPLAYNKDMQEDKEAVFDAMDTVNNCLEVFLKMFATLRFNTHKMYDSAQRGFINATDAADYLSKKGVPFREAHEAIGKMVLYCIEHEKAIEALTLEEFKLFSSTFEEDIYNEITLEACINGRSLPGGTAPAAVKTHISEGFKWLDAQNRNMPDISL